MADRTVRAIFEARVSGAQQGMRNLSRDVQDADRKVDTLTRDLRTLDKQDAKPTIDVAIEAAEKDVKSLHDRLEDLEARPTTPKVGADITEARRRLDDAESRLRALRGAKAEMVVTADTSPAEREIDSLGGEGERAGEDAGEGLSKGIIAALATIPIAGAIVGIGAAIGTALFKGIQDGLAIEAREDRFAAQVGMDPATARRFGRAAGEAYGNAWGNSVEENLDILRMSLQAGIIDPTATEAEAQALVEQFAGIVDLFEFDMPMAVRGVGNLLKNGLAPDAEAAFDLIVAAAQKVPTEDLMDTLNEYSSQWALAGLSGEQAMGLIVQAMEAGARDTDKVADAVKEMGLRVREGTDPARQALQDLGLDVDDVIARFRAGDPEGMDLVFDALRELESQGGNTQEVIAALFGGPGEDLGAALFALNIDTAAEALGGLEGSAGATERALSTMADNAATQIESAKRNIEIAADGIKGALAAAFSDEISGAAEWVQRNRGPVMQFLADMMNGAFDAGIGFLTLAAGATEGFAAIIEAAAGVLYAIDRITPGDQGALAFREWADEIGGSLRGAAETMRGDWTENLEGMRDKANEWIGPEILKANVHDATLAMTEDLDAFAARIDETGGTITINGNPMSAEDALAILIENINAEDGTVTIDGQSVPAEQALEVLMGIIGGSRENVTVGGNTAPAEGDVGSLAAWINQQGGTVTAYASTAAAEAAINQAARDRYSTIYATVRVNNDGYYVWAANAMAGTHEGGWTGRTAPGRNAGGWVPGTDPGYDNLLWPLYTGGRTLSQPLAGDEYVVNSTDARFWGPLLEWMNAGGRPAQAAATQSRGADIAAEVARAIHGAQIEITGAGRFSDSMSARIVTTRSRMAGVH